jgi:NAD-dependent SIR2 family protein deacetylase
MSDSCRDQLERAAALLAEADALLISAGAGMGVDSGLPDFRGTQGFWRAYPVYEKLGLRFESMANPRWFQNDPAFAWGFYGHRLELYRATSPHPGFAILQRWAEQKPHGAFVFTSNVDGHFQRAGFSDDRIVECHGSIHFLQCLRGSCPGVHPADPFTLRVDEASFRAQDPLPRCPRCHGLYRPNVLMFGDFGWDPARTEAQEARLEAWLAGVEGKKLAILECGAGTGVPTVRHFSEQLARQKRATLVRLNVREPEVPEGQIGIAMGALAALRELDGAIGNHAPEKR